MYILLGTVLIIVSVFWKFKNSLIKSWNIPGRRTIPIIGKHPYFVKAHNLTSMVEYIIKYSKEFQQQGICKEWFFGLLYIGISNPELTKIFFNSPESAQKGHIYELLFGDVFTGVFTSPGGPLWKVMRKEVAKLASKSNGQQSFPKIVNKAKELTDYIKENKCGGEEKIDDVINRCLLDIAFELFCDSDINELRNNKFKFGEHLDRLLDIIISFKIKYCFIFWKIGLFFSKQSNEYKESKEGLKKFANHLLESRKECIKKGGEYVSYLDFLIITAEEEKWPLEKLHKALTELVFGTADTSSSLTNFSLLFMAMYPEIQEKLFQEQLSIFGNSMKDPTLEDINSMVYLDMFVKETLRLTSVPFTLRCPKEDVSLGQYTIPKGAIVSLDNTVPHRNPKYWQNPDKFDPDHFLPENEATRPQYAFFPFSGGLRVCAGYKLGYNIVKTILSCTVRKLQLRTSMKFEELDLEFRLVYRIKGGSRITFIERN